MGSSGAGINRPLLRSLAGGAVILAVSVYGFFLLRDRPGLPVPSDTVLAVDGVRVQPGSAVDITYLLRAKKAGDPLRLTVRDGDGREAEIQAQADAYYPGGRIPLLFLIIGGVIAGLGTATLLLRPADAQARMFFWSCLAFALATVVSGPEYGLGAGWTTLLPCGFFIVIYALVPAAFSISACSSPAGRGSAPECSMPCPRLLAVYCPDHLSLRSSAAFARRPAALRANLFPAAPDGHPLPDGRGRRPGPGLPAPLAPGGPAADPVDHSRLRLRAGALRLSLRAASGRLGSPRPSRRAPDAVGGRLVAVLHLRPALLRRGHRPPPDVGRRGGRQPRPGLLAVLGRRGRPLPAPRPGRPDGLRGFRRASPGPWPSGRRSFWPRPSSIRSSGACRTSSTGPSSAGATTCGRPS